MLIYALSLLFVVCSAIVDLVVVVIVVVSVRTAAAIVAIGRVIFGLEIVTVIIILILPVVSSLSSGPSV